MPDLHAIAQQLVAKPKGILAADESSGSIEKKLKGIGLESTHETRTSYRDMLLNTQGMEQYVSGVILYDETFRDSGLDGKRFVESLTSRGVLAGIKVDKGGKPLANFLNEQITEGLDGLRERFAEYATLGATFSKWRAIITIGKDIPTDYCIHLNAVTLARYAALSQEAGIVPIVEPEVLMDGDHSQARCSDVTAKVLDEVFKELKNHKVDLRGMVLKPNMVIAGKNSPTQTTPGEIATSTLSCLTTHVPQEIPGIVFLSGGQSPDESTLNLNEIEKISASSPWELTYSYGRALQDEALKTWAGKAENVAAARKVFLERAIKVSLARMGQYAT